MNDDDGFSVAIHQSLTRPQLLMGCERELVLMLIVICGAICMTFKLLSFIFAFFLYSFGIYFLRKAAKTDPLMSRTFFGNVKHRGMYSFAATPFGKLTKWRYK